MISFKSYILRESVVIISGLHGDEPAGNIAAKDFKGIEGITVIRNINKTGKRRDGYEQEDESSEQNINGEFTKIDNGTDRGAYTVRGVDPTPGELIQQHQRSTAAAQQATPATTGAAALDLIKLIKAVRSNDRATIQQISNKYVPATNENSEGVAKYEELVQDQKIK